MKFRKKPVVIDAVKFNGTNIAEVSNFIEEMGDMLKMEDKITFVPDESVIIIHTLEGDMTASSNDFIIRGVEGEYYPCKPEIFYKTYDEVDFHSVRDNAFNR